MEAKYAASITGRRTGSFAWAITHCRRPDVVAFAAPCISDGRFCRLRSRSAAPPSRPRLSRLPALCDNAKSVSGFGGIDPNPWHSAQQQVIVTAPPCIGGRDSKTRCCDEVCACQPASPCVVPAGNPSAGYGGRGVGASCPPAIITHRFSSHALSATFIGGGFRLHARSPP